MTPLSESGFFHPMDLNYIFLEHSSVEIEEDEDDDFILAVPQAQVNDAAMITDFEHTVA